MQTLKSAAVIFCTACICAELLARLTGNSWPAPVLSFPDHAVSTAFQFSISGL